MADADEKPKASTNITGLHVVVAALTILIIVLLFGMIWNRHLIRERFSNLPSAPFGFYGMRKQNSFRMAQNFGQDITGKVTAINGSNFTLDNSKMVKTTRSTRFTGNNIAGLKVGDQVIVSGLTDTSGNIQASRVIINPPSL